jgi:hypothetical protein
MCMHGVLGFCLHPEILEGRFTYSVDEGFWGRKEGNGSRRILIFRYSDLCILAAEARGRKRVVYRTRMR